MPTLQSMANPAVAAASVRDLTWSIWKTPSGRYGLCARSKLKQPTAVYSKSEQKTNAESTIETPSTCSINALPMDLTKIKQPNLHSSNSKQADLLSETRDFQVNNLRPSKTRQPEKNSSLQLDSKHRVILKRGQRQIKLLV